MLILLYCSNLMNKEKVYNPACENVLKSITTIIRNAKSTNVQEQNPQTNKKNPPKTMI